MRKQAYTGKYHIAQLFYDDEDMAAMRADINFDFFASYAVALKFFSAGEWSKARNEFLRALEIKGSGDGPTDAILLFMEEFGNHPPSDWKGVREVSE